MRKKHQNLQTHVRHTVLFLLIAALCLTGMLCTQTTAQAATKISNPRIVSDSSMESGQKVTYDCVYFGSYPQAEVVKSKAAETTIDTSIRNGEDYIVDAKLYAKLESATKWDNNGDIVIGGCKYRRIKKEDATYGASGSSAYYYNWDTNYHYFKYQPIKWRVLSKTGDELFLLAENALDCQKYNTAWVDVTWATSTVRSWLNGYGSGSNAKGIDYANKNFADIAFTKKQYDTILKSKVKNNNNIASGTTGGEDTTDKIFFLAENEVYTDSAKKYGFVSDKEVLDEARRTKSSSYAKAMGCCSLTESRYAGNSSWWLRSPGGYGATVVRSDGWAVSTNVDAHPGVRPALKINLKSSAQYQYAGTVSTDGTVKTVAYKEDQNDASTTASAPKLTIKTVNVNQIKLSWKAVSGAKKYYIYRSTSKNGSYTRLAKVSASTKTYTDKTCKEGVTYYYKLGVIINSGTEKTSSVSTIKIPKIKVDYSYATPAISSVEKSGKNIIISWEKITKGNGYVVYRSTDNKKFTVYKVVKGLDTTHFTDKNIKSGKTYYYRLAVYGKTEAQQSAMSQTYVVKSKTLNNLKLKTTLLSVKPKKDGKNIKLKWETVKGASGYVIYRKSGNGKYKAVYTINNASKGSIVDVNLKKGKQYSYYVKPFKYVETNGVKIKYLGQKSNVKSIKVK